MQLHNLGEVRHLRREIGPRSEGPAQLPLDRQRTFLPVLRRSFRDLRPGPHGPGYFLGPPALGLSRKIIFHPAQKRVLTSSRTYTTIYLFVGEYELRDSVFGNLIQYKKGLGI